MPARVKSAAALLVGLAALAVLAWAVISQIALWSQATAPTPTTSWPPPPPSSTGAALIPALLIPTVGSFLAALAATVAQARPAQVRRWLIVCLALLLAMPAATYAAIFNQGIGPAGAIQGATIYVSIGIHARLIGLCIVAVVALLIIFRRPTAPATSGTVWLLHSCDVIWLCILAAFALSP